jgi:hypothetical protein
MNLKPLHLRIGMLALLVAGLNQLSAQTTNSVNPRDFAAFQIINERNIFDPNRRPRIQRSNPAPRVRQIVDSFSLVGTMSYSNVLLAFFEGTSSDYRKSIPVGGKIATYTAVDIQHNTVKLRAGTNDVELRVGMQMRRSEDGSWSPAEATRGASSNLATYDRQRGNDQRDRRPGENNTSDGNADSNAPVSASDANEPSAPDVTTLDPNDPVARLMLRRMQEENGGQPVRIGGPSGEATPGAAAGETPEPDSAASTTEDAARSNSNENRN